MSHQKHLRLEGAGHRLRINYRSVPRRFRTELSHRKRLQLAIFLFAMIIVYIVAMYLGWWTAREEERDFPLPSPDSLNLLNLKEPRTWVSMKHQQAKHASQSTKGSSWRAAASVTAQTGR
jgi:hypothetical protein